MDVDRERFKKMFPNLAGEIESGEQKMKINSVRSDLQAGEQTVSKGLTHYVPDVIDFIRRCDNEQQAEEIIGFMEKKGEITREYAARLRKQLRKKGVRSFGSKKEEGYYFSWEENQKNSRDSNYQP